MCLYEYNEEQHLKEERDIAKEEGIQIGQRRGEEIGQKRGEELTRKVFKLHIAGESTETIARECGISPEHVKQLLE